MVVFLIKFRLRLDIKPYITIKMRIKAKDNLRHQIWDNFDRQVFFEIRFLVSNQIRFQVLNQVSGPVWNQVWDQFYNQVRSQLAISLTTRQASVNDALTFFHSSVSDKQ